MGWNAGFTIFEATVVGAYDLGVLDKKLLAVLLEPYRGTDIDFGGCRDLVSKDGKCVKQIVIEASGATMPPVPPGEFGPDDDEEQDDYDDAVYGAFCAITGTFGW